MIEWCVKREGNGRVDVMREGLVREDDGNGGCEEVGVG